MERKVNWTESFLQEMEETFKFYDCRNGSSQYSRFLYSQILATVKRFVVNPLIGHATEYPKVRYMVIVPNYSVFYHFDETTVTILVLWDNRRNPARMAYIFRNTDTAYLSEEIVPYGSR